MRFRPVLCWLVCVAVFQCHASWAQEDVEVDESDVETLTAANFDKVVSSNQYVMAEFMAPW